MGHIVAFLDGGGRVGSSILGLGGGLGGGGERVGGGRGGGAVGHGGLLLSVLDDLFRFVSKVYSRRKGR